MEFVPISHVSSIPSSAVALGAEGVVASSGGLNPQFASHALKCGWHPPQGFIIAWEAQRTETAAILLPLVVANPETFSLVCNCIAGANRIEVRGVIARGVLADAENFNHASIV